MKTLLSITLFFVSITNAEAQTKATQTRTATPTVKPAATAPVIKVNCEYNLACSLAAAKADLDSIKSKMNVIWNTTPFDTCAFDKLEAQRKYAEWFVKTESDLLAKAREQLMVVSTNVNFSEKLKKLADQELAINPAEGQTTSAKITLSKALEAIEAVNAKVDEQPTVGKKKLVIAQANRFGNPTLTQLLAAIRLVKINLNGTINDLDVSPDIIILVDDPQRRSDIQKTEVAVQVSYPSILGNDVLNLPLLTFIKNNPIRTEEAIWKSILFKGTWLSGSTVDGAFRYEAYVNDILPECMEGVCYPVDRNRKVLYSSVANFITPDQAHHETIALLMDMQTGMRSHQFRPVLNRRYVVEGTEQQEFEFLYDGNNLKIKIPVWEGNNSVLGTYDVDMRILNSFGSIVIDVNHGSYNYMGLYYVGNQLCWASFNDVDTFRKATNLTCPIKVSLKKY